MLTITEAAAEAINALVTKHEMPEDSGLRITRQGDTSRSEGLGLSIAKQPADDDSVVEDHGVRVFLHSILVELLDDQVLDVERVEDEDALQFTVTPKPKPVE